MWVWSLWRTDCCSEFQSEPPVPNPVLSFISSETRSTAVKVTIRLCINLSSYPLLYIIYFVLFLFHYLFVYLGFLCYSNFPWVDVSSPCLQTLFWSYLVGAEHAAVCVLSSLERCLCFMTVLMYIMFGHPLFLLWNMKYCVITPEKHSNTTLLFCVCVRINPQAYQLWKQTVFLWYFICLFII